MNFKPKTEEQIDAENLLPAGFYPFTITECSEAEAKNGKPYFKCKVVIHAPEYDWTVFDNPSPEFMAHKFLHLAETVGLMRQYEAGLINADDLIQKQGECEVGVQKAKDNYPAKNIIVDYRPKNAAGAKPATSKPAANKPASIAQNPPVDDDDVPF